MIPIGERPSKPAAAPRGFALFELGFRPFYLLAALLAAFSMLAWVGTLHGMPWRGTLPALAWHQHEMLFGFALAVIAGFLLTAGRAWTGLATPVRWPLALLAVHWIAARVLVLTGPFVAAAVVDASFAFVLAAVLGNVLWRSRNRRNYFAVALLCILGLADIGFFLEQAQVMRTAGLSATAALYLIVTLVVVMGGRVVPAFTANALPQARVARSPRLAWTALVLTLAAFVAVLADLPAWCQVPLALGAALTQAWQLARWDPLATRHAPLLWVMHLSYAWIPVGLALLGLSALGWVSPSAASMELVAGEIV
jgi:uncharacterized protein involved in response to NO